VQLVILYCIVFKYLQGAFCRVNHLEVTPGQKVRRKEIGLRKDMGEEGLTAWIWERGDGVRTFKRARPFEAKDRDWAIAVLVWGTWRSSLLEEQSGRCQEDEWGRSIYVSKIFLVKTPLYLED